MNKHTLPFIFYIPVHRQYLDSHENRPVKYVYYRLLRSYLAAWKSLIFFFILVSKFRM